MCIIHISEHHSAPKSVLEEAKTALSHFPQLANVNIDVRFKKHIRKSTMQAQPVFSDVLRQKKDRGYVIYISKKLKITGHEFSTKFIPSNIIIGWLGHELGHICDYQNRSSLGLLLFGVKYLFSGAFLREAERSADTFAISNGMHRYILATKNFILDHADIPRSYKRRIQKYYLSPEEIMMLVEEKNRELQLSESR